MTDNTPLNADDELRAEIDDYIDDIRYNNEVPFDERLKSAKKSIHHLVIADRKKHELQALRYIQRELINSPKEDWLGTLGEVIDELKQELEKL